MLGVVSFSLAWPGCARAPDAGDGAWEASSSGEASGGSSSEATGSSDGTDGSGGSGGDTTESSESGTDTGTCPEGELGDDDNCGACGVACTVHDLYAFGEYGGCVDGACQPTWSPCFTEADGHADCAAACLKFGEECVAQGCGGFTATAYVVPQACDKFENPQDAWFGATACDEPPMLGGGAGRCCCTDTP